jgi:membrane AbrB-like protein
MSESPERQHPAGRRLHAAAVAISGGLVGATLLTLLHVPAGGIVGAVAGSAAASGVRGRPPPPYGVRVVGMMLLGCAAGVRLDMHTLETLLHLIVPLLVAVGLLLALDVALATLLVRRYSVDPVTALLACAPGGVSEMAILADEANARTGIVIAIHVVRVATVVLVALPLLLILLGPS